jgi:hypothetical protein
MSKPRVPISAAGPERFDTATFFATVAQGRQTVTYLRDTTIFAQGDPAEAVFFITKGRIKVTVVSRQGKEAVIAILAPDEFLGERWVPDRPADAPGNRRSDHRLRVDARGQSRNPAAS